MPKTTANRSLIALCAVLAGLGLVACANSARSAKTATPARTARPTKTATPAKTERPTKTAGHPSTAQPDTGAWGDVVVRVGRHSITKAMLAHWTAVEAVLAYTYKPKKPVPRGVVPDPPGYANCIAYLAKVEPGGASAGAAALKTQCEQERERVQDHILEILITDDWMHEEAIVRGVRVTRGEVDRVVSGEFASRANFHRFLRLTGEREADERFIVESELLVSRLAVGKPEGSLAGEVIARWTPRTSCRPGYVISVCRQYKRPASQP